MPHAQSAKSDACWARRPHPATCGKGIRQMRVQHGGNGNPPFSEIDDFYEMIRMLKATILENSTFNWKINGKINIQIVLKLEFLECLATQTCLLMMDESMDFCPPADPSTLNEESCWPNPMKPLQIKQSTFVEWLACNANNTPWPLEKTLGLSPDSTR